VAKMNRARRKGCFCCKYGWDWEKATKIVKFSAVGVGLVAGLVKLTTAVLVLLQHLGPTLPLFKARMPTQQSITR
jgi:hypothetical protein